MKKAMPGVGSGIGQSFLVHREDMISAMAAVQPSAMREVQLEIPKVSVIVMTAVQPSAMRKVQLEIPKVSVSVMTAVQPSAIIYIALTIFQ